MGLLPVACVYDASDRCGPHQHLITYNRCECDDGYAAGDSGCEPCGDHEKSANGACVCIDGYARAADGAACEPIPEELGAECDPDSADACTSAKYSICHASDGSLGYCTNACSVDKDCDGGYRCHTDASGSYCRRPPVGHGDSCQSDDDCAGKEATFCETIQSHVCLVACSAGHTDACFEGEVCCNFVLFAPICVPGDACTSNGGSEVP